MRILHVTHTTEPGGAELALSRLILKADEMKLWTPLLLTPAGGQEDNPFVKAPDIVQAGTKQNFIGPKHKILDLVIKGIVSLRQMFAWRRILKKFDYDLLHCNTTRSGLLISIIAPKKTKIVIHLRDLINVESLGGIGYQLFSRVALKRAHGVIANSDATLLSATPYLHSKTVTSVIHSPIGISKTKDVYVKKTVNDIGMVARISPWKGQDLLLHAFKSAFGGSDIRLHFYGGALFGADDWLLHLKELTQTLKISDQVTFHGHVEDVEGAISDLDICVHASTRAEPMGQNILQYLALGKPVIASAAGGPLEIIQDGNNGLLFEEGNAQKLEEALVSLASSIELRSRIARGAVEGVESDDEIAIAHHDFFRRVIPHD